MAIKKKITLEIWAEYTDNKTPSGTAFYAELQGHALKVAQLFGEIENPAEVRQSCRVKRDNHKEREGKP